MKLTPKESQLHQQFSKCGKNAKEWLRKCALMLPKIDQKRIWEKKGFSSIYEYAAKIAGMNRGQVQEALRIMRHISDKPALKKVAEQKGLNAIRPVATIATPETDQFWAQKAKTMSVHTLETYVRDQKSLHVKELPSENPMPKPKQLPVFLPEDLIEKLKQLKGQKTWEETFQEFINYKQSQPDKPEPVYTTSRHIPATISRYVKYRSRGICEHPSCTKQAAELHHTVPFSLHSVHDPDLIRHVCKEHHNIAHHGLIANQQLPPENWQTLKEPHPLDNHTIINTKTIAHQRSP